MQPCVLVPLLSLAFLGSVSPDDPHLRGLAERAIAACRAEDLPRALALWRSSSSQVTGGPLKEEVCAGLANVAAFQVIGVAGTGDKAEVRVRIHPTVSDGRSIAEEHRTFHCAREEGEWKVERVASSEDELAQRLLEAGTAKERQALLAADGELRNTHLVSALARRARDLVRRRGELDLVLAIASLILEIAEPLGDNSGIAQALNLTAVVYCSRGAWAHAEELLERALPFSRAADDPATEARIWNDLGIVHRHQGQNARSEADYRRGLELLGPLSDSSSVTTRAMLLCNIGNLYNDQGHLLDALEHHRKALELLMPDFREDHVTVTESHPVASKSAQAVGDRRRAPIPLGSMGVIYLNMGAYGRALKYLERAARVSEDEGDLFSLIAALNVMGVVYHAQGRDDQALALYERSRALSESSGLSNATIPILLAESDSYSSLGQLERAIERSREALRQIEDSAVKLRLPEALTQLGELLRRKGDLEQADGFLRRSLAFALEVKSDRIVVDSLNPLARLEETRGRYATSLELAERAAVLARERELMPDLWPALLTSGRAHRALGDYVQAEAALAEAVSVVEQIQANTIGPVQARERFLEDKLEPHRALTDLLLTRGRPDDALLWADRAKGRVLLDALRGGRAQVAELMTAEEKGRERELLGTLTHLNRQLSDETPASAPGPETIDDLRERLRKARLDYESFETALHVAHPELRRRRGEVKLLTPEEARGLVADAQTAVLEYVIDDDRMHVFVLTQAERTVEAHTVRVPREELSRLVRDFRDRVGRRDPGFKELARRLYDLLLTPVSARLQGRALVAIVPDGVLWELPFQALVSPDGRYVIEDHALFYAPSLSVLREMTAQRGAHETRRPSLLALGNPALDPKAVAQAKETYRDVEFAPLPEAEREVNELRNLYGASRSAVWTGNAAQEHRLKAEAGRYDVIHLATHGVLDDTSAMYSRLLLSHAERTAENDGLLEAWEIAKLELKADLVVLSACQSGRGRIVNGEGVTGLAWAFFLAGCPTTVASLWNVVDAPATRNLMVEFHRRLLAARGEPGVAGSKAEALRRAGLSLLRGGRYSHPFYWASFTLVGAGGVPAR